MEIEKIKDDLKTLGKRVSELSGNITNEEQTKNAFIMPFFQALGYDIFNPLEFVPEFTADVGIKKGEKVDYAVVTDGKPQILIECKSVSERLTKHDSQLFRYFGTTNSKFAILTNGKEYRFFTDLDEPNKMDSTPFLTVDIENIRDNQFSEIIKFHKNNFDIDKIVSSASELKYLNILKAFLSENLTEPTDSFLSYLVSEIYDGRKTQAILDSFKPIITKGFNQFISEKVNEKLSAALNTNGAASEIESDNELEIIEDHSSDIVTTPEELEAYTVVKMLLQDVITPDRIFYRDNRSYFNIIVDNKITKWVLRFIVKPSKTSIEVRDYGTFEIDSPLDISKHTVELHEAVAKFL